MASHLHALMIRVGLADGIANENVISITLFVSLLCACIIIGHLLEDIKWLNDSITALVLGCSTGLVVLVSSGGTDSHVVRFNEEVFFNYLLPPIIFNAGFQVKKKKFFRNFLPIIMYGIMGAFISLCIIAAGCRWLLPKLGLTTLTTKDYLALGTIFSATDSVCILQVLNQDENALLYSLVFGEGVVNDATSVVLYRAIQKFEVNGLTGLHVLLDFLRLICLSTMLGLFIGLLSAYIMRTLYFARHSTDREISLMALMAYLSYMLAELFSLSGILTVFFCGILMSHYTWHNVTESSRVTTRHAFATMSFICETFIFLYVGMDVLDMEKWKLTDASVSEAFGILGTLLSTIVLGRAAFVFPLSALSNYLRGPSRLKIGFRHQIIIWWAGLIRGAVSIALTFNQFTMYGRTKDPEDATILVGTIVVVLFTTVVFGMANKPLMRWLLPNSLGTLPSDTSDPPSPKDTLVTDLHVPFINSEHHANDDVSRNGHIPLLLHMSNSTIHHLWRTFDDACMRPVFGGRSYVRFCAQPLNQSQRNGTQ